MPTTAAGAPTWSPWPSALHDARHSGATVHEGPTVGALRWRRGLEGAVSSGPVVARDGTVYVGSNGGVLHALDPATGADRWTFAAGGGGGDDLSTSALVLPDGTVLWGPPGQRLLVALSPAGVVLWTQPVPGEPTSPVSADGRRIYVGDTTGGVTALDVGAGDAHRVAWSVDLGEISYASVVTTGTGRLYSTVDSSLVALDDRGPSGQVAWRADPGDDITEVSPGLAPDGTVLLGTNGGREWAYRPDGSLRWTSPRVITYSSPSVSADGLAYVADHAGQVSVLRIADGSRAAVHQLAPPRQIWSSVAVDGTHRFYFGTQDGHVLGVAPTGAVLFDLAVGGPVDSYPALTADRALVVGDRRGDVIAIG
ncbi:PQQ-binding-like beta-propeller repeat protein [Actinomycetospora sp.]|uniref:outer membrane protein assembly factor BamB family protein n=1 Tax=Actinomycetospora sp. TaxID=1872135 RepID=UPI002F3E2FFF